MRGGQPSAERRRSCAYCGGLSVEVDSRLGQKGLCCGCVVISVKSRADWLAAQDLAPGIQWHLKASFFDKNDFTSVFILHLLRMKKQSCYQRELDGCEAFCSAEPVWLMRRKCKELKNYWKVVTEVTFGWHPSLTKKLLLKQFIKLIQLFKK